MNPFYAGEYLLSKASINQVILKANKKIYKEMNICGKSAFDIFSTQLFIEEIKKSYKELSLNLDEHEVKDLPIFLSKCLTCDDIKIREESKKIVKKFGERLGYILLCLKEGKEEDRKERKDWNNKHWEFWKNINTVFLSGGLASGNLGKELKKNIDIVMEKNNINDYNVKLINHSSYLGMIGASLYINNKIKYNLVFDLGQSFIKRGIVEINENNIDKLIVLDKIKSKYMKWTQNDEMLNDANKLDKYLKETIINTCKMILDNNIIIGEEIKISIANYVINGKLHDRGGYGKLKLISKNYEEYLSRELSKSLKKDLKIKLIHDGTAIASNFYNIKDAASLSLGTAFGIGFTDNINIKKTLNKKLIIEKIKKN